MLGMGKLGIQAQARIAIVLVLSLVLLLVGVLYLKQVQMHGRVTEFTRVTLHDALLEHMQRRASSRVTEAAEQLANPLYYFDLEAIGRIVNTIQKIPDVSYVFVFDKDGRIIHDGSGEIASYGEKMQDPLADSVVSATTATLQHGDGFIDASSPILLGDERLGGVRIGYSLESLLAGEAAALDELDRQMERIARQHRLWIYGLMGTIALLGYIILRLVQSRYTRPVKQLADYAHAIESGRYEIDIVPSKRSDELGDLERAFARMSVSVREHDNEIRKLAYGDPLTELPNRHGFRNQLEIYLAAAGENTRLALLFIDVDNFKRVNDAWGHEVGDNVLREITGRIRQAIEKISGKHFSGEIDLARFGGDEFVILLHSREDEDQSISKAAKHLAQRLIEVIAQPVKPEASDVEVRLGASIGITVFPDDGFSAVALLKNGDIAMYQAKAAGKQGYRFFNQSMASSLNDRMKMEQSLRGAWARGEVSVVYQPICQMKSRQLMVVGAEALLRWKSPEYGQVSPAIFIALAEESELILSLGLDVLRTACQDLASWRKQGKQYAGMFVSVNVSARQLQDGKLPEKVEKILANIGLPADALHLELTETMILEDSGKVNETIRRLRSLGVRLWLDDFGMGFSGLSHLRRLPVDGVKIDRSFVDGMCKEEGDRIVVQNIINMAKDLRLTVVAEGIEDPTQWQALRDAGCQLGQGYWLGKPTSYRGILGLLR